MKGKLIGLEAIADLACRNSIESTTASGRAFFTIPLFGSPSIPPEVVIDGDAVTLARQRINPATWLDGYVVDEPVDDERDPGVTCDGPAVRSLRQAR